MTSKTIFSGCDYEDRDGVIWVWNPQHGHVKAGPRYAAYLRVERLAQRLRRKSFMFDGKMRPVPGFPLLRSA